MAVVAPSIVGGVSTAGNSTSSSTITIPRPPGISSNVLLVAAIRSPGSTGGDFSSPGFSRIGRGDAPTAVDRVNGFYIKWVDNLNNEPAEYTFTRDTSDSRNVGAMFAVRDVDTTNPLAGVASGLSREDGVTSNSPFEADVPSRLVIAASTELVAPHPLTVTRTPNTANELVHAASSLQTTSTRSTLWLGTMETESPLVGEFGFEWPASSSSFVAVIALRGTEEAINPPLGTPDPINVVTTNPTRSDLSDGQAVVSWPAIQNAARYVIDLNGSVVSSNVVTNTYTITDLAAGDYTVGVVAHPAD